MPSSSWLSRGGRLFLPLIGGFCTWLYFLTALDAFLPACGLFSTTGGATLRFWALKYGCSCLRSTSTNVTLSSLGKSSIGVSLILSRLRWRSLSGYRILGVECSMSSKNSVSKRAARLYFYLDWLNFSWRSAYSVCKLSYSCCLTTRFFSCCSSFCSRKLIKSSLPLSSLSGMVNFPVPAFPPVLNAVSSDLIPNWASLRSHFRRLITFWQKWDLFANSFSTSLWISISRWYVSIYCFILLFLIISNSVCFDWCSSSVVS